MKQWMKSKPAIALAGIVVALYSVYCIRDFVRLSYRQSTRDLESRLAAVTNGFASTPYGISQNEEFLERIKAVDASHAPTEVRQALHDYIVAYQGALEATKEGRDASAYAQPMAETKERLRLALRKYD